MVQFISKHEVIILSFLQFKVWLKPSAEQQFLYGHHVAKAGLGRITESTPQYQGVVVFSMNDIPLVSRLQILKNKTRIFFLIGKSL